MNKAVSGGSVTYKLLHSGMSQVGSLAWMKNSGDPNFARTTHNKTIPPSFNSSATSQDN